VDLGRAALLDPHLTVAMLFGDGDTSLIGQYLWPMRRSWARLPCCRRQGRHRAGRPLSNDEVLLSCLDLVSLNGVAEAEPLKMTFALEQFWPLSRFWMHTDGAAAPSTGPRGGYPAGVSAPTLPRLEGRHGGLRSRLVGVALRTAATRSGAGRLRSARGRCHRQDGRLGLLARLPGDKGDPLGDVYILGQGLELLCNAVMAGIVQFGLSVQRLRTASEIEFTSVGGWRTSGGFWLADMSAIPLDGTGSVVVSLLGPSSFTELIEFALGGNAR